MKASSKTDNSQQGMRKPVINPTEQRKRFLSLAVQLRKGTPLNDEQIEYLARVFERIGNGESSDAVFHLKRNPGQKIDNEEHRRTMSLVFIQIAHYTASPDRHPKGEGLSLKEAFEKVIHKQHLQWLLIKKYLLYYLLSLPARKMNLLKMAILSKGNLII